MLPLRNRRCLRDGYSIIPRTLKGIGARTNSVRAPDRNRLSTAATSAAVTTATATALESRATSVTHRRRGEGALGTLRRFKSRLRRRLEPLLRCFKTLLWRLEPLRHIHLRDRTLLRGLVALLWRFRSLLLLRFESLGHVHLRRIVARARRIVDDARRLLHLLLRLGLLLLDVRIHPHSVAARSVGDDPAARCYR